MTKKRMILVCLVITELVIGSIFIYKYYLSKFNKNNVLGEKSVTTISKENILYPSDSKFKYYTVLEPNVVIKDKQIWMSNEVTYTINNDGLNDNYDYQVIKPDNTYRIIALGDSFTFGQNVNTGNSWPKQLEKMLNQTKNLCGNKKIEIINLGMRGFDIPYIVERYITIGKKYNPDLIIWFESGTGFTRNVELMQPLIDICVEKKGEMVGSKISPNKDILANCWDNASEQIYKTYTYSGLNLQLTDHLNTFFNLTDPAKVYYLTFQVISKYEENVKSLKLWQNKFPAAHFLSIVADLAPKDTFRDLHPSISGQKKSPKVYIIFCLQKISICPIVLISSVDNKLFLHKLHGKSD